MLTYDYKICKQGFQMKKILAITLALSLLSANTMLKVMAQSDASPKVFRSYASKDKKQKNDTNKFEYINIEWWESFNDPILSSYIEKAVKNNHDLKAATINVEEYYQNVKVQFADQLPQAGIGVAPAYSKLPYTTHSDWSFVAPALISYEADIFLKNRDKTKSVKKLHEASKFDERAAYISVASAVGTTYFNILKLDKTISLQEEILAIRAQIYDLMLKRNKEGLTSTADTVQANKALVRAQTDLAELKKQRTKLLNQLSVLIGESPANSENLERASLDELALHKNLPAEISSEVITRRPDYLKAEKMVEKAGIDVRVAKKEFLPTITLSGLAFFNAADLGSLFTTKNMLWAIGGGALLPIFTGGKRIANLKLKKAQYERILHNYYQTNLTAIQEVNDTLAAVKLDKEKMEQTIKQAALEAEDYGYNEKKYAQGVISLLDLIQFKENLLTIDKLVAQQKAECLVDSIGLYKAAGSQI